MKGPIVMPKKNCAISLYSNYPLTLKLIKKLHIHVIYKEHKSSWLESFSTLAGKG